LYTTCLIAALSLTKFSLQKNSIGSKTSSKKRQFHSQNLPSHKILPPNCPPSRNFPPIKQRETKPLQKTVWSLRPGYRCIIRAPPLRRLGSPLNVMSSMMASWKRSQTYLIRMPPGKLFSMDLTWHRAATGVSCSQQQKGGRVGWGAAAPWLVA
jgi:hypothetical protein